MNHFIWNPLYIIKGLYVKFLAKIPDWRRRQMFVKRHQTSKFDDKFDAFELCHQIHFSIWRGPLFCFFYYLLFLKLYEFGMFCKTHKFILLFACSIILVLFRFRLRSKPLLNKPFSKLIYAKNTGRIISYHCKSRHQTWCSTWSF